jgi:hypothetical protein
MRGCGVKGGKERYDTNDARRKRIQFVGLDSARKTAPARHPV